MKQAAGYWREGKALDAGRLIFENLPSDIRPKWAGKILASVVTRSGVTLPEIERIIHLTDSPEQWPQGHDAFSAVRKRTIELEQLKERTPEEALLLSHLLLAELVAKVIYNATNPPDEFDDDSGWWVVVTLKEILDLLADHSFSRSMWSQIAFDDSQGALPES
jgi:hypothetical protein